MTLVLDEVVSKEELIDRAGRIMRDLSLLMTKTKNASASRPMRITEARCALQECRLNLVKAAKFFKSF